MDRLMSSAAMDAELSLSRNAALLVSWPVIGPLHGPRSCVAGDEIMGR